MLELTTISETSSIHKKGGTFYDLKHKIKIDPSRIEVLQSLPDKKLSEEDVQNSKGSINGSPTWLMTYSGFSCIVAESDTYIEKHRQ